MELLIILTCVIFILIFTLAILYVLKSFVNSSVRANEALLAELREIKEVLQHMELNLGMSVPEWPPENIDELAPIKKRIDKSSEAKARRLKARKDYRKTEGCLRYLNENLREPMEKLQQSKEKNSL